MNLTSFHAKYFAWELSRQYPSDDIGKLAASLQDAQVDLNPHQVDAALFAFKSPLSKGAILADEVGLGKTIEAGIILSQKWAERKRKLLIIAPANLRKQWNQELADKFYLPSFILESKSFNEEIKKGNLNPLDKAEIIICSFQFARTKEAYLKSIQWDLVIIDEAHRLRNVYKATNKIANAIKNSLSHANKVLLTATPLQNSILELFGLVSIIDEYTFGDIKSFKSQFSRLVDEQNFDDLKARIAPICKRALRRHVLEYINYTNRIAIVEEFFPYQQETQLYELVSEYLRKDKLYALPSSQRQLMTLILRKLLASSTFAISGTLHSLASKLEAIIAEQEKLSEEDIFSDFETYDELKDEWNDNGENEREVVEILAPHVIEEIKEEISELREFKSLTDSIIKNSKGEKLMTALNKGFEKLKELNANQKAIIFTESTRTQSYLKNILEANGYAGKLVLFNGSNNDELSKKIYTQWIEKHKGTDRVSGSKTADLRQALVDYFRHEATIMIATEAAAEGINLQFCSLVVNYDLPWNPQRIEQRIGRCHRYGQKFDVVVVNFLNKSNEADQRVYQLLDEKFKLFSGVFGASDEVLGTIESGVDFEKRIAMIYQNCRNEQEIKTAFDKLQQEMEPQIEQNIDLTRKNLLEHFDEDVHQKLRVSFEKGKEYLNRYEQWLWLITKYFLNDYADFEHSDDTFRLRKNPFSEESIHPGPYKLIRTTGNQKKSEIEVEYDTNIYRSGHPLAKKIIDACKSLELSAKSLEFDYSNTQGKIFVVEDMVGKSGWMQLTLLTINSFETEEHLIFAAFTDDKTAIDEEVCRKFFSLPAHDIGSVYAISENEQLFHEITETEKLKIIDANMQRNSAFFDEEYEKLDKWADDMKLSLEKEIKDLDAEIKLRKAEALKMIDLHQKVQEQRLIKDLERKRIEKRKTLFEAQDMIDSKKETLLTEIEQRLMQEINEKVLFTIKWKII